MIDLLSGYILPAALSLLPREMNSPAARAMLVAIALQESKLLNRRQLNFGPARGFWQFEKAGVRGVSKHTRSIGHLHAALRVLRYEGLIGQTSNLHYAIEDNDVLACVFARLLLWTVPGRLPGRDDPGAGWAQYLEGWRPGKPHPDTWDENFRQAWEVVNAIDQRRLT